jgi:hypothetical protein
MEQHVSAQKRLPYTYLALFAYSYMRVIQKVRAIYYILYSAEGTQEQRYVIF